MPPIRCQDGSGPDSGTIMSYCHLTYGVGAVGMRFHSRVQAVMAPVIKRAQCAVVIPIQRGDYDYNGVLDALDLAAFDAYLVQGFASLGAEQTFDMNADGVIDSFDRDLLVAQVNGEPPASWALRGTSACLCIFYTQTAPVLGTNWRAVLGYLAPPVLTTAVGTTAPLNPGVATKFGELLIALPGLGGSVVFQSSQMTDGIYAYHDFALPYQLALVGVPLYSQSFVFTQNGPKLTNAIDMVLSIY